MPLEPRLEKQLQRLLSASDDSGARAVRLMDDARRLYRRVVRLKLLQLADAQLDLEALEVACHALQLPMRSTKAAPSSRMGQVSLRDRAEQAAELLASSPTDPADTALLERGAKILREMPQRTPESVEARLLADAVNLDDFGLVGLVLQAMHLSRQNAGVMQVLEGYQKRREYGYWDARLKDGFHFEAVREMARARLKNADAAVELLLEELQEDQGA